MKGERHHVGSGDGRGVGEAVDAATKVGHAGGRLGGAAEGEQEALAARVAPRCVCATKKRVARSSPRMAPSEARLRQRQKVARSGTQVDTQVRPPQAEQPLLSWAVLAGHVHRAWCRQGAARVPPLVARAHGEGAQLAQAAARQAGTWLGLGLELALGLELGLGLGLGLG